jgi:hypothetical protein
MSDAALEAIRLALKTCETGDVPDLAQGILGILRMEGFDVVKQAPKGWRQSIYQTMAECDCDRRDLCESIGQCWLDD